jgi:hypothetical protein
MVCADGDTTKGVVCTATATPAVGSYTVTFAITNHCVDYHCRADCAARDADPQADPQADRHSQAHFYAQADLHRDARPDAYPGRDVQAAERDSRDAVRRRVEGCAHGPCRHSYE